MGGIAFGFFLCCGQLRFGVWMHVGIKLKTEVLWTLQYFSQMHTCAVCLQEEF